MEDWGELKPEGNRLELYKKLSQLKSDSSLLIIGHQPYLSEMIGNLIFDYDSDNDPRIILKKSGLAKIVITSLMPTMKGELRWLLSPKLLRKNIEIKPNNERKSPRRDAKIDYLHHSIL